MKVKKVYRHYFLFNACAIEIWLKTQAKNGWSLVGKNGYNFYFLKSTPKEKEYFISKTFSIPARFSSIKKELKEFEKNPITLIKNAYKKSNSSLKNNSDIIEIDTNKIDTDYFVLKDERRLYYYKNYRTNFFVGITLLFLFVIITCFDNRCWPGIFLSFPHLFYGFIGMIKCK